MTNCAIKQHQNRGIPGGWGVTYVDLGQQWSVQGVTPARVVSQLAAIRRDIGTAKKGSQEEAETCWRICNEQWVLKAPDRAVRGWDSPEPANTRRAVQNSQGSRDHWEHGPEKWGPIAWFWLHSFGIRFSKEDWLAAIQRVGILLDPVASPLNGCQRCFDEWKKILMIRPPEGVNSERDAAVWSWNAHNHVNKKLGKKQVSWTIAAKTYGWKIEL